MSHKIEELEAALEEALKRIEILLQTQQVMAAKMGVSWDAVVFKAKQRIATADRVQEQMEAEAAAKAEEPLS